MGREENQAWRALDSDNVRERLSQDKTDPVIEMYEHCIHGTAYDTWHNGRMAEQWAEPFIVDKLGDCFSRYDADDPLSALAATRELFLTLAKECASAYGYTTGIPEIDS